MTVRPRALSLLLLLLLLLLAATPVARGETASDRWSLLLDNSAGGEAFEDVAVHACPVAGCVTVTIPGLSGEFPVDVPDVCRDQNACWVLLGWEGATAGPFGPGIAFPVAVSQTAAGDWVAGPPLSLGGLTVTEGTGVNGNGVEELVGPSGGGADGSFALLDDSAAENDPTRWTFVLDQDPADPAFTGVTLRFCPASPGNPAPVPGEFAGCGFTEGTVVADGFASTDIDVPAACRAGEPCYAFATLEVGASLGALGGEGLFWPVVALQRADDSWVGGPAVSIAGLTMSGGRGVNGEPPIDTLIGGGRTPDGNGFTVVDHGLDPTLWALDVFNVPGSSQQVTRADVNVCPIPACETTPAAAQGVTEIPLPAGCAAGGVCQVLVEWNGAVLGAFRPGLGMPVFLAQGTDGAWAGSTLDIAGFSQSAGLGTNGDASAEAVVGAATHRPPTRLSSPTPARPTFSPPACSWVPAPTPRATASLPARRTATTPEPAGPSPGRASGPATRATVEVTASGDGRLDGWVDWNADGDWDDAGEQILTDVSVTAGTNVFSFPVPAGITEGTTVARVRLSSSGGLAPTGFALDGEVEDDPVIVRAPTVLEIPTLSPWALWLLGFLLAGLGAARLRG